MSERWKSATSRVALAIAVISLFWLAVLIAWGGFTVKILALTITAHDPVRPLILAAIAIATFVAVNGPGPATDTVKQAARRAAAVVASIDHRIMAVLVATAVVAIGAGWGTNVAGGSDSYGYVSEADLWASGRLVVSQPWTRSMPWPASDWVFAPLGYRPGLASGTIVPKYSAGFPMLMALAKIVAGPAAMFWVVPLSGGVLMLATFGIARRLGSSGAGLVAAWLVATSPTVLFMVLQPMSDVPVAAAWAVAIWLVLGSGSASALLAGVVAAIAVLIRPNLVPMAVIVASWMAWPARRFTGPDRTRSIRRAVWFLAGVAPGVVATGALNAYLYGSPFRSGYEGLGDLFAWSNVLPNMKRYARSLAVTQTPLAFLGLGVWLMPWLPFWASDRLRRACTLFGLLVLAVWIEYCAYDVFEPWWYLRFFLPIWPMMTTGLALVLLRPARSRRALLVLASAIVIVGVGAYSLKWARDWDMFALRRGEGKYSVAAELTRERIDANAVVFSGQHSGSLRYYGGRMTADFGNLDPLWLDRAVAWFAARGAHPYALLEDWEVEDFRRRFGGSNVIGRLEMTPILQYNGPPTIYLYDLLRPSGPGQTIESVPTMTLPGTPARAHPPSLVLKE
jgi:hypothetical protein